MQNKVWLKLRGLFLQWECIVSLHVLKTSQMSYFYSEQVCRYTARLKDRGETLCRHCEAKLNIIEAVFISVCVTITSNDSSWEASGHTPYHIDFSLERLLCADRGREGRNRGEIAVGDGDDGGWSKETQSGVIDVENEGVQQRSSARGRFLVKCVDVFQSHKCSNLS